LLPIATAAAIFGSVSSSYVNQWDLPVHFQCPAGQFLSAVSSIHNNHREDRLWNFACRPVCHGCHLSSCKWTGYVNYWDEPISFLCPANYFITGVESVHDNHFEDRRYKFKCCTLKTCSCSITPYVNDWDLPLHYYVPHGQVLVGWASWHDNHREDRRHKFITCSLD
ncbi:hypothetical protein EGW08_013611, partial [Elysia chlorotica]